MKAAKKHGSWDKVDRLAESLRKQRAALLGEGFEPLEPAGARVRAMFTDPGGAVCANLPHLRSRVGTRLRCATGEGAGDGRMSRHHNKTVQVELTPEEVEVLETVRATSGLPQAEIFRIALAYVRYWHRDTWAAQERTRMPGGRR